ncbi:MAG TPA: hypothetical protein VF175_16430, partial [Lacipirellula sp.]
QFLNRMAIVFGICVAVMALARLLSPMQAPVEFHSNTKLDLTSSKGALTAGIICIVLTLTLYVIFSPLVVASWNVK